MLRTICTGLALSAAIAAMQGCKTMPEQSQVKVINGRVAAPDEYPSVVILLNEKSRGMCTGTFINETTFLTAAHCTQGDTADQDGRVNGSQLIIKDVNMATKTKTIVAQSTAVVRNPLWEAQHDPVNIYDLALITFPKGTGTEATPISESVPKDGEPITFVGVGVSDSNGVSTLGVKRVGEGNLKQSLTAAFGGSDMIYAFEGDKVGGGTDGINASLGGGDSGGPLFYKGQLVGVCSGHGYNAAEGAQSNFCVKLATKEAQEFLQKMLPELKNRAKSSGSSQPGI